MLNKVLHGDCFEWLSQIEDCSIDLILCDLPYGKTRNKWDSIIPLDKLWKEYERVIKYNGAIVLTSSGLFTVDLINSNRSLFKYKIVWKKTVGSNQFNVNYAPLKIHEDILVFSKASACYVKDKVNAMTYNPQFSEGEPYQITRKARGISSYDTQKEHTSVNNGFRFPTDVVEISNPRIKNGHPTQKPVELFEYLIKTYTNEDETVLDNCLGSGTTAVACINTNRNFIGIEKEWEYCEIANNRLIKGE